MPSATLTVKLVEVVAVGMPEITPVVPARESPAGKVPKLTDQVGVPVSPVCESV